MAPSPIVIARTPAVRPNAFRITSGKTAASTKSPRPMPSHSPAVLRGQFWHEWKFLQSGEEIIHQRQKGSGDEIIDRQGDASDDHMACTIADLGM